MFERQTRGACKYSRKIGTTPITPDFQPAPFLLVCQIFPSSLAASLLALSPHIRHHHQGKGNTQTNFIRHTIYAAVHRHHHLRHLPDLLNRQAQFSYINTSAPSSDSTIVPPIQLNILCFPAQAPSAKYTLPICTTLLPYITRSAHSHITQKSSLR